MGIFYSLAYLYANAFVNLVNLLSNERKMTMAKQQQQQQKKPQKPPLVLMTVSDWPTQTTDDGKKILKNILNTINSQMIKRTADAPSKVVSDFVKTLSPIQTALLYGRIKESDIEKVRNTCDVRRFSHPNTLCEEDRKNELLGIWKIEAGDVRKTSLLVKMRLIATIDYVKGDSNQPNQNTTNGWLDTLKQTVEADDKLFEAMALDMVNFNEAQAITFVKTLKAYVQNNKLQEFYNA